MLKKDPCFRRFASYCGDLLQANDVVGATRPLLLRVYHNGSLLLRVFLGADICLFVLLVVARD